MAARNQVSIGLLVRVEVPGARRLRDTCDGAVLVPAHDDRYDGNDSG
jgi:hypothetical protein